VITSYRVQRRASSAKLGLMLAPFDPEGTDRWLAIESPLSAECTQGRTDNRNHDKSGIPARGNSMMVAWTRPLPCQLRAGSDLDTAAGSGTVVRRGRRQLSATRDACQEPSRSAAPGRRAGTRRPGPPQGRRPGANAGPRRAQRAALKTYRKFSLTGQGPLRDGVGMHADLGRQVARLVE
jgi:hypothetical protein